MLNRPASNIYFIPSGKPVLQLAGPTRLFCNIHRFEISICNAVSQFNGSAKKGVTIYSRHYKDQIKHSSTKSAAANIPQNTKSGVKCVINEEKKNNTQDKSYIPGTFSDKVTLAIDFTDDSVVQCECDVPVVKNTFENDRK